MQQEALVSYGSWGVFAFFSTPTIFPGPFSQEHVSCKNMNLSSPAPHRPIHMLFIKSKNKKNAISRRLLKISISFKKREREREKGHVLSSRCHECLLFDTCLSLTSIPTLWLEIIRDSTHVHVLNLRVRVSIQGKLLSTLNSVK